MNNEELKNLIIYTGVFYQDNEIYRTRSQIWFKTFDNARKLGIKVVVRNDGGLPDEMLNRIKAYENITIVDKKEGGANTLGGGRREALQKAIEIADKEGKKNPVFLWTEPEKDDLIMEKSLLSIIAEIRAGSNIAVLEREEKAWDQLPPFQRWVEKRANKKANEIIQSTTGSEIKLDWWFAPKAFDKIGARCFLDYNSNKDRLDLWDSIMVPILNAIRDGKKVKSVPVDFLYNKKQIDNESDESNKEIKIKRIEQYAQILKELGDEKWIEFFEDSKDELDKIKELNKGDSVNKGELLKEAKKSVVNKFFK
ncbi:MAG: hypothetical protein WC264_02655 [Candidatus Paceibacterota bacterium]|jgi:hypothetical protein